MTVKGKVLKIINVKNDINPDQKETHLIIKADNLKYNKKPINEMIIKTYNTLADTCLKYLKPSISIKASGSVFTKNDILFMEAKSIDYLKRGNNEK